MTEQAFRRAVVGLLVLDVALTAVAAVGAWRRPEGAAPAAAPPSVRPVPSSSSPDRIAASAAAGALAAAGAEATGALLRSMLGPVRRAAADHGDDPAELLPDEAELEAAVASGSLDSPAARRVVARLRAAYARYGMPFPELPGLDGGARPAGAEAGAADDAAMLRALLRTASERLRRAAERAGEDPSAWVAGEDELRAAEVAGSADAPAARAVLDRLRAGYAHFGLAFPEPDGSGG